MSTLNDCIGTIINKIHNKITLNYTENYIFKEFNTYVICDIYMNNLKIVDMDNYINTIQHTFIQKEYYIIKLMFSNDRYIYTSLDILTKINYFKIMFEGNTFGDNCVIDIVMVKEMDNYDTMEKIIYHTIYNSYIKVNRTFKNLYDTIIFLDFINCKELFLKVINDPIIDYDGVNVKAVEHIYNVFDQNAFYDRSFLINLLKHCDDIDSSIFDTDVFKKNIIKSQYSYDLILKYKKTELYNYLYRFKQHHKEMILDLLDVGDNHAWTIIEKIIGCYDNDDNSDNSDDSDDSFDYGIKLSDIYDLLLFKIDQITEIAWGYRKVLNITLWLELAVKLNKIEEITDIADIIIRDKIVNLYDKLFDFLKYHNKDNDQLANVNMDEINPIKKLTKRTKNIQQITSYYPFNYKTWHAYGNVVDFKTDQNKKHIIIESFQDDDIKVGMNIMIGETVNSKYGIYPILQTMICEYDFIYQSYIPYESGRKYTCIVVEGIPDRTRMGGGMCIRNGSWIYIQ